MFAIAFLSLAYVVGHRLGAHPIAFILYSMVVSADGGADAARADHPAGLCWSVA